ncbi:hypothetical protein HYS28_00710 [Candidatus Uhrbacteria bacterium]|nr:hypothetical protein [Candidatus Uhrbacteria bacterium]
MRILFLFALGLVFALPAAARAETQSWPASSGTTISGGLTATATPSGNAFEPSDATIVDGALLVVSDEGDVATMGLDGSDVEMWLTWANNDQEGVTVVGDTLYVLNERERDVFAYDLATHALLRTYDLSPWISGWDNEGPEGMTYHNGQWLVGHSLTEEVYAFDLSGDAPSFLGSWNSGLHVRALHSGADGKLYVMSSGRVAVFDADGGMVDYALPANATGPEGFALAMDCAAGTAVAIIAYDSGPIYRYENFPVSCPATAPEPEPTPEPEPEPAPIDADGDGVIVDDDCNDADATVASLQTYYRDADGDTLGDASDTTSVCASSAPSGYVTNMNDTDDTRAYFTAVGATNGSIVVTYGDGSSKTYQVYVMTTTQPTTAYQYKDSSYLVVVAPFGKRVAVVDAYTGEVVAMRWMPKKASVLASWLAAVVGY